MSDKTLKMCERFRGFLPVVVDVETSGIDPCKNALLEIAAVFITMEPDGTFIRQDTCFETVLPFDGAILDRESLEFNGILDPFYPLRFAVDEKIALKNIFTHINRQLKEQRCNRAVLVGHNAWFDLLFVKEAIRRTGLKSPFHAFTCFDTATLAGAAYGQTVLSKAVRCARLDFNSSDAHSAIYDAEKTADLFCAIMNRLPLYNDSECSAR